MPHINKRVLWSTAILYAAFGGLSILAFAQEKVVRVGVAIMQNQANTSVPGNLERDRLVQAFNRTKTDKTTHIKIQAVALDGMTANDVSDETEARKCAYVVFTKLTEFRTPDDPPVRHTPSTPGYDPDLEWSVGTPHAQSPIPELRAIVEYKLAKMGKYGATSGTQVSRQGNGNDIDTVSDIMEHIAVRVADEIRKGALPMQEQVRPPDLLNESSNSRSTSARPQYLVIVRRELRRTANRSFLRR
jgi:hypothetical protein